VEEEKQPEFKAKGGVFRIRPWLRPSDGMIGNSEERKGPRPL
jgi:hypothetical protein